jgi:phosphoserine phosphatase RsbU/P
VNTEQARQVILIVDDTLLNLDLLAAMLRGAGYDTIQALSGLEARLLAQELSPDLILLDLIMPVEDGITACRMLKQDPRTADIPVIFLSAMDDSESKVKGLAQGAVDYITKPFHREEVLQRVKLHLSIREKYACLARQQAEMLDGLKRAQQHILIRPAEIPEAGFAVCYRPMRVVGGDFFDVIALPSGCHDFFIADISGHDLAASFNTSALKALFRQSAQAAASPIGAMQRINSGVIPVFADGMHLTACLLHLDRANSQATFVNAGHLPVIHLNGTTGQTSLIKAEGDILGAFEEIVLCEQIVPVAKGDRLFLYTDGLVEKNSQLMDRGEGIIALSRLCAAGRFRPLADAVSAVCDQLFLTRSSALDDVILLGIEV